MVTNKTIQLDTDCCKMKSDDGYCPRPLETASEFLSKKWAISIIITIGNFGKLRFNELLTRLEGATAKTLTDRLKELEKEGIIKRKQYSEIPPRVDYSLTPKGKKLRESLLPLIKWADNRTK
jgi:DNA-binding HxlR family transcriptional regulator